jgi:basic amino acid/polyamine antiporter, APA family
MERPFRTPFVPVVPILGIITSLYLVYTLPRLTKEVVFAWLLIGLIVYFTYSTRHSKVQTMQRGEKPVGQPMK